MQIYVGHWLLRTAKMELCTYQKFRIWLRTIETMELFSLNPHSGVKGKFVIKLTSLPRLIGIPMVCARDAALPMMGLPSGGEGLRV